MRFFFNGSMCSSIGNTMTFEVKNREDVCGKNKNKQKEEKLI